MQGKFLHACLIAEDTTLGTLTGGVDGENGQATSLLTEHVDAELVDARRLACARHTAYTHTDGIATVGQALVDDDAVGDLHDAAFDALQLVACACHLDEQEEIDHGVTGRLALSHTDSLHEDMVETRRLTEDDGLTRLAGHTTQGACRG